MKIQDMMILLFSHSEISLIGSRGHHALIPDLKLLKDRPPVGIGLLYAYCP